MKKNILLVIFVIILTSVLFVGCDVEPKRDKNGNIVDFDGNSIGDPDGKAIDLLNDNNYIFYAEKDGKVYLFRPRSTSDKEAYYNFYVYDKSLFGDNIVYREDQNVPDGGEKFLIKTTNNSDKKNGVTSSSYDGAYPNGMGIEKECIYDLSCSEGDPASLSQYGGELQCVVDYFNSELIKKDVKSYSFYLKKPYSKRNDSTLLNDCKLLDLHFTPWAKTSAMDKVENK